VRASDDREAAAVFDFIDEYLGDLGASRVRPLADYLARYRGFEEAIAREYLALRGHAPQAAAPIPIDAADAASGAASGDTRRIGHYQLLRELGRGGQGSVWLAEDVRIARRVALKVLASRFESVSAERRKRFRREAEVIARLEHPGICPIYDADIECDTPWIAMRLVEGHTLAQLLGEARTAAAEGRAVERLGDDSQASEVTTSWPPRSTLDLHRTLLLFERAARALHAAHEAGVIHRDFKPGNVIVTPDGKPVVLDFGLARETGSEEASLTESGEVFGTPAYMSPEQLRADSQHVDRRTDVYSLGVALYEALTLKRPFEAQGNRSALYAAIEGQPAPDPRALNEALTLDVKVVLETAMEKDRARRYATALELAEDLRRIREYEPIRARPAGIPLRFARWTRRHPALALSIICTIVALAAGLTSTSIALVQKDHALTIALGKHLAQRCEALAREDPSAALVLGIQAVDKAPNDLTRASLFEALDASHMAMLYEAKKAEYIHDLALSPRETELALACRDGTIHVYDVHSGQELCVLGQKPSSAAVTVAWSPDASALWSGHADGHVARWDYAARRELARAQLDAQPERLLLDAQARTLACRTAAGTLTVLDAVALGPTRPLDTSALGGADGAVLLPEGGLLAWNRAQPVVLLWTSSAPAEPQRFSTRANVTALVGLGAGAPALFAAGTAAGTVECFRADASVLVSESLVPGLAVEALVASPDGALVCALVGTAERRQAFVLDCARGEVQPLVLGSGARPLRAAFAPRYELLALAGSDNTLSFLDVASGSELRRAPRSISTTFYRPEQLVWSADAQQLYTRSNGQFAYAWHALDLPGVQRVPLPWGITDARLSADGQRLRVATLLGLVASEGLGPALREGLSEKLKPSRTAWMPSAPVFAAGGECWVSSRADAVHPERQAWTWTVESEGRASWSAQRLTGPGCRPFLSAAGETLVLVEADGGAQLVGAEQPAGVAWELPQGIACQTASFDEAGTRVALGTRDGRVYVLDARSGRLLAALVDEHRKGAITALAFRPGTDELAAFGEDFCLQFWNVTSAQRARPGTASIFPPRSVAYSRDGKLLLVTGRVGGGALRLFTLEPFAPLLRDATDHKQDLTAAEFSADARYVLSASRDGSVFVRDSRSGQLFARRVFEHRTVLNAHFDAATDNPRVVSVTDDGEVRVWPIDPLPAARARFRRELDTWEKDRERRLAAADGLTYP
jgi:serine/threonine protein kinase/WD40 repeat protein